MKRLTIGLAVLFLFTCSAYAQSPVSIFDEDDAGIYHWSKDLLRYVASLGYSAEVKTSSPLAGVALANSSKTGIHAASETYNLSGVLETMVEYYASGNIKSVSDDIGMVYTFIDEDYWGASIPQGRLARIDFPANDAYGRLYYEFSYYGDSNVVAEAHVVKTGSAYTETFYNEEYYGNDLRKVDSLGNIVEAGKIWNGAAQSWDVYLRKISPTGGWNTTFGSTADWDCPHGIALDSSDDIFVIDQSNVLRKYSSSGTFLWGKSFGMKFSADDIVIDSSGNIYMTGVAYNDTTASWDICKTVKLDASGNALWERMYDGPWPNGRDSGRDIFIDGNGNIVVNALVWDAQGYQEGYRIIYDTDGGVVDQYWCKNCYPWNYVDGLSRTGRQYQRLDASLERTYLGFYGNICLVELITGFSPIVPYPATVLFYLDESLKSVKACKATVEDAGSFIISCDIYMTTDQGPSPSLWVRKAEYSNGNTAWFLWGNDVYGSYDNVVIEKTAQGAWNAYTFNPSTITSDPIVIVDSVLSEWQLKETITDPASIQGLLPELGDWEEWCARNNIWVEYPPLSSDCTYEQTGLKRLLTRLDHNDYLDTRYEYQWNADSTVTEHIYHIKNSITTLVSDTIYNNGADYDPSHKSSWQIQNALTYYESGNMRSYYSRFGDNSSNLYIFHDEDYYNYLDLHPGTHGRGRLLRYERKNQDGTIADFHEFEYYGDTLSLKNEIRPAREDGNILPGAQEEQLFYDENLLESPRVRNPHEAVDSQGNRIISTVIIRDDGGVNAYVAKYNSQSAYQWSCEFETGTLALNAVVATDSSGNIYAAVTKTNGTDNDVYVYKYDSNGNLVGSPYQYIHAGVGDFVSYIAVDSAGNIFVSGTYDDYSASHLFLIKLDSNPSQVWTKIHNFSQGGYISFDEAGNVLLHGECRDGVTYPDYYKVAYNSSGESQYVRYDELELQYDSYDNTFNTGRTYKYTDTLGGVSDVGYAFGWIKGTGISAVGRYMTDDYFPPEYGAITCYNFNDTKSENWAGIGDRRTFGSSNVVTDSMFKNGDDRHPYANKVTGYDANTYYFLWNVEYTYDSSSDRFSITGSGTHTVIIEKSPTGQWAVYELTGSINTFAGVMDKANHWLVIGPISNPQDLTLPELGSWEEHNVRNNIIVEFPPLSVDKTYDGQGRVIERIDHNDYIDTRTVYQWGGNGWVTELVYHEKDGASSLISKTVYNNGADYDLAHKSSWGMGNQLTYYESGNLSSAYNGNERYKFLDEDYYSYRQDPALHEHGRGRLIGFDRDPDATGDPFRQFEYYGSTLILSKDIGPFWENNVLVPGAKRETIYYNEDLFKNPRVAIDPQGNKVVASLVITDDFVNNARVVKYDSSGAYLWAKEFRVDQTCFNVVTAVDGDGNVYVAATKWSGADSDVIVYKYDAAGNQLATYLYANSGVNDHVSYIIVDSSNNVYLSGTRGQDSASALFLVKLTSGLSEAWNRVYDTPGCYDHSGYLTLGGSGGIVLHGAQHDSNPHCENYKAVYDSDGNLKSVTPDEVNICFGTYAWNGREYKVTKVTSGKSETTYDYGLKEGTNIELIFRMEGNDMFPESYGGFTVYQFLDPKTLEFIGAYAEFDNGMRGEVVFKTVEYDPYITKVLGYDANTYWFFWDVKYTYDAAADKLFVSQNGNSYIAVKKTPSGQWTAYTFDPQKQMDFAGLMQSLSELGPISNPQDLTLPELGNWEEYNARNNITVEFPPLSTTYTYDPLDPTRVIERLDHNDYTDVRRTYQWDTQSGKVLECVYHEKNGVSKLISKTRYNNGIDYDLSHKSSWAIENAFTYYMSSGNTRTFNDGYWSYTFEDADYFNVKAGPNPGTHGQGRVIRQDKVDGSESYEYEYYGNSLRKKTEKSRRVDQDGVTDRTNTYIDEAFHKMPNVTQDGFGNTIVTGSVNNDERIDAYVIKYDNSGNKLWSRNFIEGSWMHETAVTTDSAGNIIVAAGKWNGTNEDFYVAKYSADGTKLWEYTYDGGGQDRVHDVGVDSGGNIILTGSCGGYWPNNRMLTIKLNPNAAPGSEVVWSRIYDEDNAGEGYTVEVDANNNIFIRGAIATPSDNYKYWYVQYDLNGNIIDEGYDVRETRLGQGGRRYTKDTRRADGSRGFGMNISYATNTNRCILEYSYIGETSENALIFNYYEPSVLYPTGSRAIFDSGMIVETKEEDDGGNSIVKPTKATMPDCTIYWFLWDVTYKGQTHQYVVIENTLENAWNDYTFIPDTEDPSRIMNKDNWTSIDGAVDFAGITLPESRAWPQSDFTVEYPAGPTLYYDSGRVRCYNMESPAWVEYYKDEDFYAGASHEGRLQWRYRKDNDHFQYTMFNYFKGDNDRVLSASWYGHDPEEGGAFDWNIETYYNEKFHNGPGNDGYGRMYQMTYQMGLTPEEMEKGTVTFLQYYKGTDHVAAGTIDVHFGTVMHIVGSYKNYYDAGFTTTKMQVTLEAGSIGWDGNSSAGWVTDLLEEEHNSIMKKIAYPANGTTIWFIYDGTYLGINNVALVKTAAGDWHAYTFDPNLGMGIGDSSKWTDLPPNQQPVGDQTALVEGYWPTLDPNSWILPGWELESPVAPNADIAYKFDAQGRVVETVENVSGVNVRTTYQWNIQPGRVLVSVYNETGIIENIGTSKLVSKTIYDNGTDYEVTHAFSWQIYVQAAYYDSGNLKTFLTNWGRLITYMDEDRYETEAGQGRIIQIEESNGQVTTVEYYDNPAGRIKSYGIVGHEGYPESYYDEDYFRSAKIATDSNGNTVEIANLVNQAYLNFDCCIIKRDAGGNKIWSTIYNEQFIYPRAIAVDSQGNIIVTGEGPGGVDWAILKFDPDGNLVSGFPVTYSGAGDTPKWVAVDAAGNIIVTGRRKTGEQYDFLTVKYDSLGNFLWQETLDLGPEDCANEVYVGTDGTIEVIGNYKDSQTGKWSHYAINYDADGNVTGQGSIGSDHRSYGLWELGGITGRQYQEEFNDGSTSFKYGYYRYCELVNYQDDLGGGMDGGTFYNYFEPSSEIRIYGDWAMNKTGERLEFDGSDVKAAEMVKVDPVVPGSGSMLVKIEMRNNDTMWLLWGNHEINGQTYTNVVVEHTAGGDWIAFYGFNPDTQNPGNVMNPANWIYIGVITNPETLTLPELGDWWEYNFANYFIPEFPALSTNYYDDDQNGLIDRRIDHNGYLDTTYNYTWDTQAGTVLLDTRYDYDNDETPELAHTASFNYNGYSDPQDKEKWTKLYEINYDSHERVIRKLFGNGDFILTDYYTNGNKEEERSYGAGWAWKNTTRYWEEYSGVKHYDWIADPDAGHEGDIIYREYDLAEKLIYTGYDDNGFMFTDYYANGNKQEERSFGAGWAWENTIRYWEDYSGVKRYEWFADPDAGHEGNITYREYDSAEKLIYTGYDDNGFMFTDYYANGNKQEERSFGAGWAWENTIRYWEDYSGVKRYEWFADPDAGHEGDIIYREYDLAEKLIYTGYDDNGFMFTDYYANNNKHEERTFGAGWAWKSTLRFWEDQAGVKHYEWIVDPDAGHDGDINYKEYDSSEKLIYTGYDDNGFMFTGYYANGNKNEERTFGAGWVWKNTTRYWEDQAGVKHYDWIADPDAGHDGDTTYREYDSGGKLIYTGYDDNGFMITDYYANGNKQEERTFGAGWAWKKTTRYWEDYANIKQFDWLADPDGIPDGDDLVYIEYNTSGNPTGGRYDDGSWWTPPQGLSLHKENPDLVGVLTTRSQQNPYGAQGGITSTPEMAGNPFTTNRLPQ